MTPNVRYAPIELTPEWALAIGWRTDDALGEIAARPLVLPRAFWDEHIAAAGLVSNAWRVITVQPGEGRAFFYVHLPASPEPVIRPSGPPGEAPEDAGLMLRAAWRTHLMRTEYNREVFAFTARIAMLSVARVAAYEANSFHPTSIEWGDTG